MVPPGKKGGGLFLRGKHYPLEKGPSIAVHISVFHFLFTVYLYQTGLLLLTLLGLDFKAKGFGFSSEVAIVFYHLQDLPAYPLHLEQLMSSSC